MKKKLLSGLLTLALVVSTCASMIPAYTAEAEEVGTTYYVSSIDGDDSNDGLSEDKAFATLDKINEITLQPGDQVLLEKGSVFEDQALHIQGSGSAEAPIKISVYGEGDRPQINTNGHGQWEQNYGGHLDNTNHKWKGTVSSSILLKDVEYIEISGLEITNDRTAATDTEKGMEYNDPFAMDRTGVAGVAKDKGTIDHIVLDDLYIHDVTGNVYNKHMANGGIYFIVETPQNESETGIARYNDVQIRNCYLDTVNRWGIAVGYTYQWGQFKTAALSDDTMEKYGSSNVLIENNYVVNSGGDAITTMYLDRPVVQYNVSQNAAKQINTTDYSKRQPQLDPTTGEWTGNYLDVSNQRVAAGIWPWKCKNAVFQYNECFNTMNASNGNGDGQPWDSDYGDGTNYQYNYSHGNSASTIMFCGVESINNTFRYNISQNEDMGPLDPAGNTGNCHVYNNTFYIKEGLTSIWSTAHANNGPMTIENNIFYFAGDTPVSATNWNPGGNKVYDNNLFYNVSSYPNDENAVKVEAGTEVLVDAGSGPVQAAEDGQARKHDDPNEETVFDGYKLAENSPALNAGKAVTDQNGFEIEHDFFGHAITAVPEIGAAESDMVSLAVRSDVYQVDSSEMTISAIPKNTTVAELKKNLIYDPEVTFTVKDSDGNKLEDTDVVTGGMTVELSYKGESLTYIIAKNTDNELKETGYMVKDQVIYVPFTEKNPTTAGEVLGNVTVHETASAAVLNGEEVLGKDDAVADGMTLRITAENGAVNDYTITQKNTYNWTLDYAGPQQGNVWFGQMKTGDGAWTNMTNYDPTYPNWQVNTYYGPGIDAPSHTAEITDAVHGLLSAPPNTNITTAMAFRAPKTGTVSFEVKDGEPYLRQAGNSGGTVTLSLLLNDEVLQSVTLEASNVQAEGWADFDAIEVNEGDYIRVTAKSNNNPTKPSLHVTPSITYQDVAGEEPAPEVDKTELEAVIADADEYAAQIGSYTPETAEAFQAAYDAAKAVFADAEASQEDVDNAAAALQTAIDGLKPVQTGEVSTAVLEYALELAENVDTEGVVDSVVEIFNNTKAEAQELLDRVQAGDATVTQDMVDQCWKLLIKTMQYMSFKSGDMTDLQKVVDMANSLDLTKYLEAGQKEFKDALAAAEAVLEEEFAEQNEIDQAWKDLLKAMSELRLKPSKDALEALIAQAQSLNIEGADEETAAVFRTALARAMSVLDDENATKDEVAAAGNELQSAVDQILAAAGETDDPSGNTPSDNTASDPSDDTAAEPSGSPSAAPSDKSTVDTAVKPAAGSSAKTTVSSGTSKAAKTGDASDYAVWAAALLLSAGMIVTVRLRKKEQ